MRLVATNVTRSLVLGSRVEVARTLPARLVGLLGRASLPPGHGLWIEPCTSVHTLFMRFPIDVLYLDPEGRAIEVLRLPPWRAGPVRLSAKGVLELPPGAAGSTRPGDLVRLEPLPKTPGPG